VQYLYERIQEVNQIVHRASLEQQKYAGMGTTLVMGCFVNSYLYTAHAGDSRAYRLRGRQLERLTRDHSPTQALIDSGIATEAEIRNSFRNNLVNLAIGVYPETTPEFHVYNVMKGDIYLFCSDGLTDMVEDRDIAHILQTPGIDLFQAGVRLIRLANHHGGMDNISIILVKTSSNILDKPEKTE
jgi:protein phosphatase